MKLKLNPTEFKDVYSLLQEIAEIDKPVPFANRIVYLSLIKMYKTFYNRDFETRRIYRVTINEEQALAFWLYFIQVAGRYPVTTSKGNVLNHMLNNIHQQYIKP